MDRDPQHMIQQQRLKHLNLLNLFEKRSNSKVTPSSDGSVKVGAQPSRVKTQRSLATNISLMLQLLGIKLVSPLCSWLSPSPSSLTGESVFSPPLSSPCCPSFSQSDCFVLKLENNSNYLQVPTDELAQCSCHPKGVNAITRSNINRHELKAVSFHRPHLEKISSCMINLALLGLFIEQLQYHFVL